MQAGSWTDALIELLHQVVRDVCLVSGAELHALFITFRWLSSTGGGPSLALAGLELLLSKQREDCSLLHPAATLALFQSGSHDSRTKPGVDVETHQSI